MAVLDTTFLIDLLRGKDNVSQLLEELDTTESILAVGAPSAMELWAGAILADASEKEKKKVSQLLDSLQVYALDLASAKEAGDIEAQLIKDGSIIQAEDIMIAGIARMHGEKVVTRDNGYARIPNLRVLKY